MSYARINGFGDDTTADPPPSAYCAPQLQQIASMQNTLEALTGTNRSLQSQLSSCQASAGGAAAGCAQGVASLQQQIAELTAAKHQADVNLSSCQAGAGGASAAAAQAIATLNAKLASLQAQLDAANSQKPRSCKWWIIATVCTAVGAVALQLTKGKRPKESSTKRSTSLSKSQ
jgi:hypothetical protein